MPKKYGEKIHMLASMKKKKKITKSTLWGFYRSILFGLKRAEILQLSSPKTKDLKDKD